MEDINSQQNIREFSIQAFRKICDAMVLSPPKDIKSLLTWDEKRYLLLDELYRKLLEHAGESTDWTDLGEMPGLFLQKHMVIEALGKYWHVHSMNLETIIDEFVFNVVGRKQ